MSKITGKQGEALSFINGKKFGIDTWTTIYHFGLNVLNIISSIELYGILIEKLDKNNLVSTHNAEDIIRIKQQIVLDVIMKTQILIESTLVLIHSLSTGYHAVARNMTYYDMGLVNSIIKEIGKNKQLKNYKYNMRKILGLPNLKYLSLSLKEKKFLNEDFERFEFECLKRLKRLTDFYDKFRVIYGKSKHGLAFLSTGSSNLTDTGFDGSILQCLGRISNEDKRPKGSIVTSINTTPAMTYKFFDYISIVKFDKKLIDEINSTISDLKNLVSFICTNHESYALNSGKGYLPYSLTNGKRYMLTSREAETENEKNIIKSIADKNLGAMYLPRVEHIIKNIYTNPKIIESLGKDTVTNILIP